MGVTTEEGSAGLLRELRLSGPPREAAVARLHALLLRVARAEAARRRSRLPDRVREEIDDLCTQAASDAAMGILRKLDEFRGTARFTTWACKFAIFEISTRLRRHAWRDRLSLPDEAVGQVPARGPSALGLLEHEELSAALQRAVAERLTDHQRTIFQAAAVDEIPIDALAERFGSTRGAIYKTLHDARRRLREALIDAGHVELMA